jgi:polysaccharide export outer membrane protein
MEDRRLGCHTLFRSAATLVLVALVLPASAAQLEAQQRQASLASPDDLTLRPGDAIRIRVWPQAELSGEFEVEDTGVVHLPFLGSVQVEGTTVARLRNDLRAGYEEIMKEPVVTITPLFNVGVLGGVRRPGIYRIDPTQNILDVILEAGGFVDKAKEDQVQIIRDGQILDYNVERALEEAANLDELQLRSGDKVMVPVGSNFSFRDFTAIFSFATTTALLIVNLADSGSSSN